METLQLAFTLCHTSLQLYASKTHKTHKTHTPDRHTTEMGACMLRARKRMHTHTIAHKTHTQYTFTIHTHTQAHIDDTSKDKDRDMRQMRHATHTHPTHAVKWSHAPQRRCYHLVGQTLLWLLKASF
mmetsp:Transcript_51896/g.43556  ORF Transcript_51896/g.43556 Transcript_51896/m.43556 type:complete len:127 (+) Transcript_51896:1207-1587(+)